MQTVREARKNSRTKSYHHLYMYISINKAQAMHIQYANTRVKGFEGGACVEKKGIATIYIFMFLVKCPVKGPAVNKEKE